MAMLCLGAVLTGLIAGCVLPVLPFACAVVVATVLGASWATSTGMAFEQTTLSTAAMLIASQVGYGFGLILLAAVSRSPSKRSVDDKDKTSQSAQRLRTGNRHR